MPHFIIDCSQEILELKTPEALMRTVYEAADATGLFAPNDIKVRLRPFEYYKLGNSKESFVHVFGYVMEGRTAEQKAALSRAIVKQLSLLLDGVSFLSMNIDDFELATYCNKSLINPDNIHNDRHFEL